MNHFSIPRLRSLLLGIAALFGAITFILGAPTAYAGNVHSGGNSNSTGSCVATDVRSSPNYSDYTDNVVDHDSSCSYNDTIPADVANHCNDSNTILVLWLTPGFNDHWFNPASGDHLSDFNSELNWVANHYASGSWQWRGGAWMYDYLNGTNYFGENPSRTKHYGIGTTVSCVTKSDVGGQCPTRDTSKPTSNVLHWVRPSRSGDVIPAKYNTDAKRGDYCFYRHDNAHHTRTFTWSGTTPGTVYDYDWQCVVAKGTTTHAGPTAFQPQPSTVVYTPLGLQMQQDASNNTNVTASQVSTYDPQKNSADRCHSTLTANNKTWLAEGDVLNVQQFTQRAAIDHDWVRKVPQTCDNSRDWDFKYDGTPGDATMTAGAWSPPCDANAGRNGSGWSDSGAVKNTSDTYYLTTQTPELTGLWQSISEHANSGSTSALGHADALTSNNGRGTGITDVSNGDPSHHWSGSAVTASINAPSGRSPAAYLVWGAGASDPKGTNTVGFFDKEAAYNGVKQAQAGSGAFQTQFRDNTPRPYVTDLYVPKAEGVVHGDFGTALSTTVSRWNLGTPYPGNVSNSGTFSMQGSGGQQFFGSSTAAAPTEKDWTVTTGSAQKWGQVSGQVNQFLTAADWPSDAGKPQVFSVKWEYAPTVDNTIPTTVGYNAGGVPAYTTSVVGVPVQGKVQNMSNGAASSPALFNEQELYTGTGSTNSLDGVLYWGTALNASNQWTQRPDQFSPYYNGLQFVRGTHE